MTENANRESILEDALISATEKNIAPGITLRKITLADEILFRRAGVKILNADVLEFFAEYAAAADALSRADGKAPAKLKDRFIALHARRLDEEEDLLRAAFICATETNAVRALCARGSAAFDDAFFAWIALVPRAAKDDVIGFMLASAVEVAAASFKTTPPDAAAPAPKNGQTPPPQPS